MRISCCDDLRAALRLDFLVENTWGVCFKVGPHDSHVVPLHHCPWCGSQLAKDKRELTPSPVAYRA